MPKSSGWLTLAIAVISVFVFVVPGCKKQPVSKEAVEQARTENDYNKSPPPALVVESPNKAAASPLGDSAPSTNSEQSNSPQVKPETDIPFGPRVSPKPTLRDIIRKARTWGPAYSYSYGQKAPDFTLTDIKGKQHKLSNYRGKNVLIIFWATWCGPCKAEVPHLITLRNSISEDELAMLAISYKTVYPPETVEKVKAFVEQNEINYTVFSTNPTAMPLLFGRVSSIPCSFFIDSEGKIKLATEGLLSLGEIKAILAAEW